MKTGADSAMQSDPNRNPQFRRHWRPPDPKKQRRRPGKETAPRLSQQNSFEITALVRHAQRPARVA